jgi:CRP/FNR family transcriptional regulator
MAALKSAVTVSDGRADTADRLCAVGHFHFLERGCELTGDPLEDRLVYIARGCAKLCACTIGGRSNPVLAFHFAGDIVSVLRQSDTDFRLAALSDLELVMFSADEFLDIAQDDPAVLRAVLTRSLQALNRSRTRMMQLGHKSARQRIAGFLVSMAERLCNCTCGSCEYALPMSRRDIGDSLGLTIETVSRQFSELRETGLVETKGRSLVRITDVAALACEAGNPHSAIRKSQN